MDPELARLVGQRIRRVRRTQGRSLRQQAELAAVSPAALSALENGRGGMSLTALQRVAEKLDMSIDELLAAPPRANGGTQERKRVKLELFDGIKAVPKPVRIGRGAVYQFLGDGKGHMIQPYILTLQPGAGFAADPVSHAGEEFAYVAFGDIQFLLGKTKHRLRQGDSVRFFADTPHAFENLSTSGVALVIGAATPPW